MKNIILISIDDLRFDCIGGYFDKKRFRNYNLTYTPETPVIDGIASKGVSFSSCIAPSSLTPPSHASMFTGLYPNRHRVYTFYDEMHKDVISIAEILKKEGFRTYAKTENAALKLQNITKGIDYIDDILQEDTELFEYLKGRKGLNEDKNFIFIHLFDCHSPYGFIKGKGNEEFIGHFTGHIKEICARCNVDFDDIFRKSKDKVEIICKDYDSKSSYLKTLNSMRALEYSLKDVLRQRGPRIFYDITVSSYIWGVSLFDRIKLRATMDKLDRLGLLNDAVVVITADHGEAKQLLDGDIYFSNSSNLYEGHIRVPLIFSGDCISSHREISQAVSLVDIVPTILDIAGIRFEESQFDGLSLKGLITGSEKEDKQRAVFGECWAFVGGFNQFGQVGWQEKRGFRRITMARDYRFKLVRVGNNIDFEQVKDRPLRDFIESLYNDILGRFANIYELILWQWLLKEGKVSKAEVFEIFIKKAERNSNNYLLIDAESDYDDENNLFWNDDYNRPRKRLLALLEDYKSHDDGLDKSKALDSDDEEKIKEHLRTLGYL